MQLCVKIDDAVVTDAVFVEEILSMTVSQPLGPGTPSNVIVGTNTDALTSKSCLYNGICNIKTQLPSKFFVEAQPKDLRIDGVAILAFGIPATAPPGRRLRATIRGLLSTESTEAMYAPASLQDTNKGKALALVGASDRILQGAAQSEFGLNAPLTNDFPNQVEAPAPEATSKSSPLPAAAGVLVAVALVGGVLVVYSRKKQQKQQTEKEVITTANMQANVVD
jgi:hypothetical protein